jgi:hypothetical protein
MSGKLPIDRVRDNERSPQLNEQEKRRLAEERAAEERKLRDTPQQRDSEHEHNKEDQRDA